MQKKWRVKKRIDSSVKNSFPEINSVTLQLLFNRGLDKKERIDDFLSAEYGFQNDPFLFSDMKKAVREIKLAIKEKKKITIYGDYDADGVTSTAVLSSCLKDLGASCDIYIPDRESEGYGLNEEAIGILKKKGTDLIITVDCGISNYEEIRLAKKSGMEVIITDHHHPPDNLPRCLIINPKADKNYPFKELAGVGVAFKLAQALFFEMVEDKAKAEAKEKWLLDLVAVGTIADCVPLIGENRILTKYGVVVLNKTKRKGLGALIKKSSLNPGEIGSYDVSFRLSPRINAAGRMKHANIAYKLLMSKTEAEAEEIAEGLNTANSERQKITETAVKKIFKELGDNPGDKILFSLQEDCPAGILGLVAGKISDYYNKPAFVFTKRENEIIGSGRSVENFNIIEALGKMEKLFSHYGGHSQACGLTLKDDKLFDDFKAKMLEIAEKKLSKDDLIPVLNIDAEVKLSEVNWGLFEDVCKFEPFGNNNVKPIFLTKNLKVLSSREVGQNGNHLKIFVSNYTEEANCSMDCIGFSLSEAWRGKLKTGDIINLVYQIDENRWNGNRELQLKIIDLKQAE